MTETSLLAQSAHHTATAIVCWLAVQWYCRINPTLFDPRPSTTRSRLLKQLVALLSGVTLGAFGLAPEFGGAGVMASLVGGAADGAFATVGHRYISKLVKSLQQRALAKVAGEPEKTAPKKEPTE